MTKNGKTGVQVKMNEIQILMDLVGEIYALSHLPAAIVIGSRSIISLKLNSKNSIIHQNLKFLPFLT